MTLPTEKKKRARSSPAEEHEADDGGSLSQPTKRPRLTSNRKNLQPNSAAASASPTLAASPTQPDNEETPLGPPARSEDPSPTKRQNPLHQQDPPDASLSRSSTKGRTPSLEQGYNEEMGSHGEPPTSRELNATEEQIMVRNHFEISFCNMLQLRYIVYRCTSKPSSILKISVTCTNEEV